MRVFPHTIIGMGIFVHILCKDNEEEVNCCVLLIVYFVSRPINLELMLDRSSLQADNALEITMAAKGEIKKMFCDRVSEFGSFFDQLITL